MPEKLEKQIRFMTENNYSISFTSYKMIDEDGNDLERIVQVVESVNLHQYLKNTIIGYSSSMIDLKQTGKFQIADIRIRVDTQVWLSLLKKGFVAYGLDEVLMVYRVHKKSISSNKLNAAKKTWNLYYNIEKLGFFRSVFYFSNYAFNAFKKHYL
jgi:teichuronic acid biosynthesis glycosyltransferase TuaG